MTQNVRGKSLLGRVLGGVLDVIVGAFIVLDEIVWPLYRPLGRWIASLALTVRLEAAVARLPRFAILVLLAVPFAVAEPLKVVGLIWIGEGRVATGLVTLALAYLASFVLVERIYQAGREKLLTIGWFAWSVGLIAQVRQAILDRVRATAAWAAFMRMKQRVRTQVAALLRRFARRRDARP